MANNDENNPIKEYTPFSFNKNFFEDDFAARDEYYLDELHNCSNDLSDRGSRREEREHAKFAEKIRKNNSNPINIQTADSRTSGIIVFAIFFVVIIIISIIGSITSIFFDLFDNMEILKAQEENQYYYENDYNDDYSENYYDENSYNDYNSYYESNSGSNYSSEFEDYTANIKIEEFTTESNEMVLQLNNNNIEGYSDIQIRTIFYDYNGGVMQTIYTPINVILGENIHYIEIENIPTYYYRCEHDFIESYTSVREEFNSSNVNLQIVNVTDSIKQLRVNNYASQRLERVEFALVYFQNDKLIKIETTSLNDIEVYDESVLNTTLNYAGTETTDVIITINDIYF